MSFNPEEKLKDFPCTFNLITGKRVSHQRFQQVKNNLQNKWSQELGTTDEEKIRDKNLLTWVLFSLNEKTKASDLNKEALVMSGRKNITSLGNLVFLCCLKGDKIQARKHFEELQAMKSMENFDELVTEAVAEQGYCYSRLGGFENCRLCTDAFKDCIKKYPDRYLWKFGLGLVYRRLTNHNLYGSSKEKINVDMITADCARLMFEVAEKGNDNLRGLAYAQLVHLKQCNPHPNTSVIFKNMDILQLADLALRYGSSNPSVLTMCGKSIKVKDVDKSIKLLKDSIHLQENGMAYHHLGLSLLKKMELRTNGRYHEEGHCRLSSDPAMKVNQNMSNNSDATSSISLTRHAEFYREFERHDSSYFSVTSPSPSCRAESYLEKPSTHSQNYTYSAASGMSMACLESLRKPPYDFQVDPAKDRPWTPARKQINYFHLQRPEFQRSVSYSNQSHSGRRHYCQPERRHQKQRFHHFNSEDNKSLSKLKALKEFVRRPNIKLNIESKMVKEAITCFEKALEVSHDENIPARLSLADVYLRSDLFQEALSHSNLIIESAERGYVVSIICAHEKAGKCLKKLSEMCDPRDSESFNQKAKEHFLKALSMAADLASLNPDLKTCESKVWDSLRQLQEDVEGIESLQERRKQRLKLLELAKDEDIARVIKEMLVQGLELDDIDVFLTGLNSFLKKGDYEEALTFLNLANLNSALTQAESWISDEVVYAQSRTYICTAWSRLLKGSPDSRRIFQQMFQLKFGHCAGMTSADDEDEEMEKWTYDVLTVNDESADSEDGPDVTTIVACNVSQVFQVIFGLETSRNLERSTDYNLMNEEAQLQEMKKYHLILLIVGENDGRAYSQMLQAVHNSNNPNIIVITVGESKGHPEILKRYRFLNIKEGDWLQTKLLADSSEGDESDSFKSRHREMSRATILEKIFDGNKEAVMKLFCFVMDQDFEKHKQFFKLPATRTLTG